MEGAGSCLPGSRAGFNNSLVVVSAGRECVPAASTLGGWNISPNVKCTCVSRGVFMHVLIHTASKSLLNKFNIKLAEIE